MTFKPSCLPHQQAAKERQDQTIPNGQRQLEKQGRYLTGVKRSIENADMEVDVPQREDKDHHVFMKSVRHDVFEASEQMF